MRLGYIDKIEKKTVHYLPKKNSINNLFNNETASEYAQRFFSEIKGLGNVLIVYRGRVIENR